MSVSERERAPSLRGHTPRPSFFDEEFHHKIGAERVGDIHHSVPRLANERRGEKILQIQIEKNLLEEFDRKGERAEDGLRVKKTGSRRRRHGGGGVGRGQSRDIRLRP